MNRMMSMNRLIAAAAGVLLAGTVLGQSGLFGNGTACGCPELTLRDTVWVTDNDGAGIGTATWTCDHVYVLTEQAFVNSGDTLTVEAGTVVLGMPGSGRVEYSVSTGNAVGSIMTADYDVFPGALVVARGAFLQAEGTSSCPIQFTFLGDPLDGSTGLDVQGQWGGLVVCGAAAINTLYLEGISQPSQTGGVGTGEDRAEGIVDLTGQDRHVYGGNTAPNASSAVLRYLSIRHGSTNLGWNNALNGNETDLLQLAGCGQGTVIEYVELVGSSDDGLHILGGTPDVRHVISAFHAEDAFESDQGWQGSGQFLFGIQDTALAHPTNPPSESFVWRMHGDDYEESNVDFTYEPFTSPWMSNLTLLSNGAPQAISIQSLPAGDWLNTVVHGVSVAGIEARHYYSCDGFPAIAPFGISGGYGILRVKNWRIQGTNESASTVQAGHYDGIYPNGVGLAYPGILADSNNVVQPMLVDGEFAVVEGAITEGLDPRPIEGNTVSPYYQSLDPRLMEVTYHGAFDSGSLPWFEGWTALSAMGLLAGSGDNSGCTYSFACNYDQDALEDDGSCEFFSCAGCTYMTATNYDPAASIDNGACNFAIPETCTGDLNGDNVVSTLDLLDFLSVYGSSCPE